jgi:cytochrome c oxidase assembly factor CtaG
MFYLGTNHKVMVSPPLSMWCPSLVIFFEPILAQMQPYPRPFMLEIIPTHGTRALNCIRQLILGLSRHDPKTHLFSQPIRSMAYHGSNHYTSTLNLSYLICQLMRSLEQLTSCKSNSMHTILEAVAKWQQEQPIRSAVRHLLHIEW